MSIQRSPGQKRKLIVITAMIIVFAAVTYGGSLALTFIKKGNLEWIQDHQQVAAVITGLESAEEEYRSRKGRKRTRTVYDLTYSFIARDEEYSNTVRVSHAEYSASELGENIDVLYFRDSPEINDLKTTVESDVASNTPLSNALGVMVYSGPLCLFLYWLLKLIFVRESRKALPEGFYTEHSWLDIDDNFVVAIDNGTLVYFDIHAKKSANVQRAYQKGASLEELVGLSGTQKVNVIPLSEITWLSSSHNSDIIVVRHNDEGHSIEFLNQTVKAHALDRIRPLIPASLEYSKVKKTRLQAVLPIAILIIGLVATVWMLDVFVIQLFAVFITFFWAGPRMLSRLIDPAVVEKWAAPTTDEGGEQVST